MQNSKPLTSEWVILLHGLGRTPCSLRKMAKALRCNGYHVVNLAYPSRRLSISAAADAVIGRSLSLCRERQAQAIHCVTHSLGGILLRDYLHRHDIPGFGAAVMLAPPNQGSEIVDHLRNRCYFRYWNGPAGQQLGTGADDVPRQLGNVEFPLGVIAGNRCAWFDRYFGDLLPRPNDGKVSVASAKVCGMLDFLELPVTHTWLMDDPTVIRQTLHFLRHRRFMRDAAN